jgi:hypothetical protein
MVERAIQTTGLGDKVHVYLNGEISLDEAVTLSELVRLSRAMGDAELRIDVDPGWDGIKIDVEMNTAYEVYMLPGGTEVTGDCTVAAQAWADEAHRLRAELAAVKKGLRDMQVSCQIEYVDVEGDRGMVEGVCATCSRCGHATESAGTSERSIRRCLALMREECPEGEENFYVDESD